MNWKYLTFGERRKKVEDKKKEGDCSGSVYIPIPSPTPSHQRLVCGISKRGQHGMPVRVFMFVLADETSSTCSLICGVFGTAVLTYNVLSLFLVYPKHGVVKK
jgi:hypothetical protein